jgi:hypothetical protein
MNVKKYLYISIGVFLLIVFLAAGITAEFRLSNITSDVYDYIEKFFSQWSLALSAAGTIILAISVFFYIYENRRSQKLALFEARSSKLEEWASYNSDLIYQLTKEFIRSEESSTAIKQLESEKKALQDEKRRLQNQEKKLEIEKNAGNPEANDKLVDVIKRLIKISEKEKSVNKQIVEILQLGLEDLSEYWKEGVKIDSKVDYNQMIARPIIYSMGDSELIEYFDRYSNLRLELHEAIRGEEYGKCAVTSSDMLDIIRNMLSRLNELREKNY